MFDGETANPTYAHLLDHVTNPQSPASGFTPSSLDLSGANVNSITQTGVNTYDVSWSMTWPFNYFFVSNADNSKTAQGSYQQTCSYVSSVKYVPTSSAPSENSTSSGSSSGSCDYSSSQSNGSGNDSTNFLIESLDLTIAMQNAKNNVTIQ